MELGQKGGWTPQTDIINMNIARLICKVLYEKGSDDENEQKHDEDCEESGLRSRHTGLCIFIYAAAADAAKVVCQKV